MMRRRFASVTAVVALASVLVVGITAQQSQADVALRAAMELQTVRGDLNGAIDAYKKIVDTHRDNRAVTAQALLHMAEAYQKLGSAEAGKVYGQIVRDYPDQPAAATARARMSAAEGDATTSGKPTARVIVKLPWWEEPYSRISSSGRFIAYVNWQMDGDLFVRDLTDGSSRRVTSVAPSKQGESAEGASISPDDQRVAYSWKTSKGEYELRMADLGRDVSSARVLMSSTFALAPADWTPDGRQILVQRTRPDRTKQIIAVAVDSGQVRVLKTVDWRGTHGLYVSPDGRQVAFSQPASDTTAQADINVLALDASREITAVSHSAFDQLLGWSADGRRLIFASDRGGRTGLWAIAYDGTRTTGEPRLIMDIGAVIPRGITRSGTILYSAPRLSGVAQLRMTSFDFDHETASTPVTIAPGTASSSGTGITWSPAWSPDGTSLAYLPEPSGLGRVRSLVIRSNVTGEQREMELQIRQLWSSLAWSPDGRSIVVSGSDLKGRYGMHRIDPATGASTPIALAPPDVEDPHFHYRTPEWAPDGRSLYFRRPLRTKARTFEEAWMRFDLADGSETELFRATGGNGYGVYGASILVSPDGRYLASKAAGSGAARDPIIIIPTDGSPARELVSTTEPSSLGLLMWAPDSRSLFVKKRSGNAIETWRYTFDGTPHRVRDTTFDRVDGVGLGVIGFARVAPDGKHVVFGEVELSEGDGLEHIWALERVVD